MIHKSLELEQDRVFDFIGFGQATQSRRSGESRGSEGANASTPTLQFLLIY